MHLFRRRRFRERGWVRKKPARKRVFDDILVASYESSDEARESVFDDISIASYESGDETFQESYGKMIQGNILPLPVYEALDRSSSEFRILTLGPARNKTDDVYCTLERVGFDAITGTGPAYEALSYAWGDTADRFVIYVDRQPFLVTPNLDVALRYLRKRNEPRVLWIDAVCIDQQNSAEKTHQVGMMGGIYRNASRVLVWLGESDRDIRKAMAFLQREEERERLLPDPLPNHLGQQQLVKANEEENEISSIDRIRPLAPGIRKIFPKTWWFRLWVVQELLVANDPPLLGCGRKWVSWEVVRKLMLTFGFYGLFGMKISLSQPKAVERGGRGGGGLADILEATCDRKATEPHDKIYALLGLATAHANEDIDINYGQPYSIAYQKAMVHILKSAENLNFLMKAMNRRGGSEVPSWCVDFSIPEWNSDSYLPVDEWQRGLVGASCGQNKSTIFHQPDRGTIQVLGTIVGRNDQIHVSECRTHGPIIWDKIKDIEYEEHSLKKPLDLKRSVLEDIVAFTPLIRRVLENRFGKNEALEMLASGIFWKTAANGGEFMYSIEGEDLPGWQRYMLPSKYSAVEKYAQLISPEYRTISKDWSHLRSEFPEPQTLKMWAHRKVITLGFWLMNESFLTTDTGYLARAPTALNALEVGDLLCIIYGCRAPIVLRPLGESYRAVTFAHVNELANGEYFDGPERQTKTFTLC